MIIETVIPNIFNKESFMPIISKNKPYNFVKNLEFYTIKRIKDMGSHPSEDHLNKLLELFKQDLSIDLKER